MFGDPAYAQILEPKRSLSFVVGMNSWDMIHRYEVAEIENQDLLQEYLDDFVDELKFVGTNQHGLYFRSRHGKTYGYCKSRYISGCMFGVMFDCRYDTRLHAWFVQYYRNGNNNMHTCGHLPLISPEIIVRNVDSDE